MLVAWKQHGRIMVICYVLLYGCPEWGSNQGSSDYKSGALPLSYVGLCAEAKKIRRSFAKYLAREYREKTTLLRIFMRCNLSSCWVLPDKSNVAHQPANRCPLHAGESGYFELNWTCFWVSTHKTKLNITSVIHHPVTITCHESDKHSPIFRAFYAPKI